MNFKDIGQQYQRFGAVKTLQDIGLRGLHRLVKARILKGVTINVVDPQYLACEQPFHGEFLDEGALTAIVRGHPEYEMSEKFLRQAFAKGDECYAIMDGSTLAAYGWYSNQPTEIDVPELMLHFDPSYIYMYKGYTHVKYRGKRLHSVAMTRALDAYLSRGFRGFVSYVVWNNFSSLKSCYRMGYRDFGNVYLLRAFGRYRTFADRSCTPYGFRLDSAAEVLPLAQLRASSGTDDQVSSSVGGPAA